MKTIMSDLDKVGHKKNKKQTFCNMTTILFFPNGIANFIRKSFEVFEHFRRFFRSSRLRFSVIFTRISVGNRLHFLNFFI